MGCRPNTPSITIYDLIDGAYTETTHVSGDQTLTIERPVALTLTPAELRED